MRTCESSNELCRTVGNYRISYESTRGINNLREEMGLSPVAGGGVGVPAVAAAMERGSQNSFRICFFLVITFIFLII